MNLPTLALSVRQPWAWAMFHASPRKDVENRDWHYTNPGLRFRGPVAIHAAQGLTREEYESAAAFMASIGVNCPPAIELERGGIVGSVVVQDIVHTRSLRGAEPSSISPWFFGPLGLLLRRQTPCTFVPAKGQLGFFAWSPAPLDTVPKPARWMHPVVPKPVLQGELL